MAAAVAAAAALPSGSARAEALLALVSPASTAKDVATLKAIVDAAVIDAVPAASAKPVLMAVHDAATSWAADYENIVAVADHAVTRLQPRVGAFEEADFAFRFLLYRMHAGAGDHLRAGMTLSAARLSSEALKREDRARAYVRCAQAYNRVDDDVNAESAVRKASELQEAMDPLLRLQFKAAFAQVTDAKRRFVEAASKYLDVLRHAPPGVPATELIMFTEKAAICACLSPPGPARQRIMATLSRSEHLPSVAPPVLSLFERMAGNKVISKADVAAFEARLMPHQKATGADGATVMQRAMTEHNMLAASRTYKSIRIAALGELLGVDADRAERVAAKMIAERRLAASIDQLDGFVDFAPVQPGQATGALKMGAGANPSGASLLLDAGERQVAVGTAFPASASDAGAGGAAGVALRLAAWDAQIRDLCLKVNAAVEAVGSVAPHLLPDGDAPVAAAAAAGGGAGGAGAGAGAGR